MQSVTDNRHKMILSARKTEKLNANYKQIVGKRKYDDPLC